MRRPESLHDRWRVVFREGSGAVPLRFRSPNQYYALIGVALLMIALGLIGATQDASATARISDAVAAVLVGGAVLAIALRAAVVVGAAGVSIRNPVGRTRQIPWSEIEGFRIGRYQVLANVCLVELKDGSTVHAWAIQIPRASGNRAAPREAKMIEELNRILASHRGTQTLGG